MLCFVAGIVQLNFVLLEAMDTRMHGALVVRTIDQAIAANEIGIYK